LDALESYLAELRSFERVSREEFIREPAARLKGWMGFRNVLVHFYLDIDHGRSYDAIREDLGDLQAFAAAMAHLLSP
jgi:uncharacterized protein YutE (UPF0331/DUF86 family)